MKNPAVLHNFQTQLPWFLMTENWGKQPFWTPLGAGLHIQGLWISDGNLSSRFSSTWWFCITTKSQKQGFFNTRHAEIHMVLSPCSPSSAIFGGIQSPSPRIPVDIASCFTGMPVNPGRGHCSIPRKIPKLVSGRIFFGLIPAMFDWRLIQSPPFRCHLYVGKIVNYPLVN